MAMDKIIVKGARENNLKNVDIELPKNKLIVMTGLSGSGKSSLAFDTIYSEGQRRYVESLSAYVRQFLGGTEKPDVDAIEGLSPSISIDQKTTSRNPRSTVGTVTEIYDYLRLLFARTGTPYCPNHNIPISSQTVEEMVDRVLQYPEKTKLQVLAPVVNGEKGTQKKLIEQLKKDGYVRARIDGDILDLDDEIDLEKNKKHTIEVIIDRLVINEEVQSRLSDSLETALKLAEGKVLVDIIGDKELLFSENFACPHCDFSISELEPRLFSFNSPYGACPTCKGLGTKMEIDEELIVPDRHKTILDGAIKPFASQNNDSIYSLMLEAVCRHFDIPLDQPFMKLTRKQKDIIFYGSKEKVLFDISSKSGAHHRKEDYFEGVIRNLERRYKQTSSQYIRDWIEGFMIEHECSTCKGARLKPEALNVFVDKENINEVTKMNIEDALYWINNLELTETQRKIANLIVRELNDRLTFLQNVGLDYLTLNRMAGTLSGGEAQRIRLATQIGSRLTGVLYVLDEPSIGLHQRDNDRLIETLKGMRDIGNTLIVVEHDEDTMLESDYLVDIGPGAGIHGGQVVAAGTPKEVMENDASITGQYLSGKKRIEIPEKRRKGNGLFLEVKKAQENNLNKINVKFPLGTFTCVTGVSGSGKSTLVNEILYKGIATQLYTMKDKPGKHEDIIGLDYIDKVIDISQSPIGRTPRSNPATYTGVFDNIRDLYTMTNEAKMRGYGKGRFSFNVKGGRCEACRGDGVKRIEMHFLPDVYVPCEICHGKRYNRETLEVKYKAKNIADVLELTVEDALEFFENVPKIKRKLQTLFDVGLGYIKLGQPATTLSGGEAQRVKLAKELQKRPTGKSLFILDEPTTGLHSHDITHLIKVLQRIVDHGDTVVVIEHNLDMIKVSDYIIDMGPEGGHKGGKVIAKGTPEKVAKVDGSYTGIYLNKILNK
jgi:excinuclease ABC subunit A